MPILMNPSPEELDKQKRKGERVTRVSDLIDQCHAAAAKMSADNDHRILLENCAYAMTQLVDRLASYEKKVN